MIRVERGANMLASLHHQHDHVLHPSWLSCTSGLRRLVHYRMPYLIVTSLAGALATQILVLRPSISASHVLHVPSWQSYLILMPVPRAMSLSFCPGTTVLFFDCPLGPTHVTVFLAFCFDSPASSPVVWWWGAHT